VNGNIVCKLRGKRWRTWRGHGVEIVVVGMFDVSGLSHRVKVGFKTGGLAEASGEDFPGLGPERLSADLTCFAPLFPMASSASYFQNQFLIQLLKGSHDCSVALLLRSYLRDHVYESWKSKLNEVKKGITQPTTPRLPQVSYFVIHICQI